MKQDIFQSYQMTTQQIEVSSELKEKTIRFMTENKRVRKYVPRTYATVAAAALAVVVGSGIYLQTNNISVPELTITESLSANAVDEQVALSKGVLNFAQIPFEFGNTDLNLGLLEGEMVKFSEEEYFSYLGRNPLPSYLPKGFVKHPSGEQMLTRNSDGTFSKDWFSICYTSEQGCSLEIVLSALGIPDAEAAAKLPPSDIDGIPFKVGYRKTADRQTIFLAYFEHNGIGYSVRGEGLSQEDFIQTILSVF